MEISTQEYNELVMKVQELQRKVNSIDKQKRPMLYEMVDVKPYEFVKNTVDDYPAFGYIANGCDVWHLFTKLAKLIHMSDWKFYMGTTFADFFGFCEKPYIRSIGDHSAPRKFTDLTKEQQQLSADMLNEMIPIWNKYFKMIHRTVLYDAKGNGEFCEVPVLGNESM